jgi:hypothetical protein
MIINPYIFAPSVDPDAQAFITAAGITDTTQQSAIRTLVTDLKGYNIWTKFKAIYPIVGGTASTHKWNLKDPRDLDAAFRLTFTNSWTHSSTGMTPSVAFANTYLNENTHLTLNNLHMSYYSRTNNTAAVGEIGTLDNTIGGNPGTHIHAKWTDGRFYPRAHDNNGGIVNSNTSQGLFITNRTNSTQVRAFRNNVLQLVTSNSIQKVNLNVYIGAINRANTPAFETNRECAFASIGDGLTDAEAANFYTAVQTYQTTLGRQV